MLAERVGQRCSMRTPIPRNTRSGRALQAICAAAAPTKRSSTAKVSAEVAQALKPPAVAKRLPEMSVEAVGSTPAEMAQERERWGKVIRAVGTKAD